MDDLPFFERGPFLPSRGASPTGVGEVGVAIAMNKCRIDAL